MAYEESIGLDVIRSFFAIIDRVVYNLVAKSYEFINEIAKVGLSDSIINDFTTRVYTLIGLFMLFKLSFSFINYIINPDSFNDSKVGAQNIIKNVVISLVLLIMAPWGFNLMWTAQNALLDDRVVETFVFGNPNGNYASGNTISFKMDDYCQEASEINLDSHAGNYISLVLLRPFYGLVFNDDGTLIDGDLSLKNYCTDKDNVSTDNYLTVHNAKASGGSASWDEYEIDYLFLVSTIVGIAALGIILSMCLDIALRAVKLGFLQLIAPVPILSYIDPKSKDGMLKKWLKELGSTWATLFVKLFSFNFAIFMIVNLINGDMFTGNTGKFLQIFVIIGCLMFAKQLPSLIGNIFGVKMDGSGFSVNPFKKISKDALGGKYVIGAGVGAVAGSAALAGGVAANSWALGNKIKRDGLKKTMLGANEDGSARTFTNGEGFRGGAKSLRNIGSRVFSPGAGGVSAGLRAATTSIKNGDKMTPIKNASSAITESSMKRNQRADGKGLKEEVQRRVTAVAGIKNDYGLYGKNSEDIKRLSNLEAEYNTKEEIARKAQTEFEGRSGIMAESFVEGFRRNPEGTGERLFDQKNEAGGYMYSGATDFDRYNSYMDKVNRDRVSKGETAIPKIAHKDTFESYAMLDHNSHYYNNEHEKVKKDLSKAQKLFEEKNK